MEKINNKSHKKNPTKIIVLSKKPTGKTGGEIYNLRVFEQIMRNPSCSIEFCAPNIYKKGITIKKIFAPIIELKHLKAVRNNDICFMSSTMAYRHMLLMIFIRMFFPRKGIIVIHHHYEHELLEGVKKIIVKFLEISFLKMSTSLLIPSPYTLNKTKTLFPTKKIHYIELAFTKTKNDKSVTKTYLKGEFLYVGTIEKRKGLHFLIKSLNFLSKERKDFKLNIIGRVADSEYYNYLLKQIEDFELKNNVIFHGYVPEEKLNDFYLKAELFIFPSLLEGYGMVLMEAMSFGIPVIAFDNSAISLTVKHGYNGLLAENKNPQQLYELIKLAFDNSDLRSQLSKGALQTYENCRNQKDFEKDVNLFINESLLKK
jgi:glycosyltransferase involved in cell wall biosynthesis